MLKHVAALYCSGVAGSYAVFNKPYESTSSTPITHNYYKCKSQMVNTFTKPILAFTWPWSIVLLTTGTLIKSLQ